MILDDNNQHGREWEKNDKGNLFVVLNFTILSFEKTSFFFKRLVSNFIYKKNGSQPFLSCKGFCDLVVAHPFFYFKSSNLYTLMIIVFN